MHIRMPIVNPVNNNHMLILDVLSKKKDINEILVVSCATQFSAQLLFVINIIDIIIIFSLEFF